MNARDRKTLESFGASDMQITVKEEKAKQRSALVASCMIGSRKVLGPTIYITDEEVIAARQAGNLDLLDGRRQLAFALLAGFVEKLAKNMGW